MVLEDTLLDGQYLLKKGNVLHIPAKPIHKDTSAWGPQAGVFDPYRFIPAGAGAEKRDAKTKIVPALGPTPLFVPCPSVCLGRDLDDDGLIGVEGVFHSSKREWLGRACCEVGDGDSDDTATKENMRLRITARVERAGAWTVIIGEGKTQISLESG
jgi:hypothetical protein